jgi:hypothetical protein
MKDEQNLIHGEILAMRLRGCFVTVDIVQTKNLVVTFSSNRILQFMLYRSMNSCTLAI